MITGYFCIDKTDFRWRGIVDIYCTTLFYSVAFLLLAFILDKEVTKRTLLLSIMPIRQELYWFVSSYIGLMMVAPFFARFASLINKRQYKILLGTLFVISFEYLYGCLYAGFKSILFFSFLFLLLVI